MSDEANYLRQLVCEIIIKLFEQKELAQLEGIRDYVNVAILKLKEMK